MGNAVELKSMAPPGLYRLSLGSPAESEYRRAARQQRKYPRLLLYVFLGTCFALAPYYQTRLFDTPVGQARLLACIEFLAVGSAMVAAATVTYFDRPRWLTSAVQAIAALTLWGSTFLLRKCALEGGMYYPSSMIGIVVIAVAIFGGFNWYWLSLGATLTLTLAGKQELDLNNSPHAAGININAFALMGMIAILGAYITEFAHRLAWLNGRAAVIQARGDAVAALASREALVDATKAIEVKSSQLAHSLSLVRATLQSTADGILVTNENGRVTDFNQQFVAMWHVSDDVMASEDHSTILLDMQTKLVDPHAFHSRAQHIISTSSAESFDLLRLADGQVFERFSKVRRVNGKKVGRVWSFRDSSEQQRASDTLETIAVERQSLLESERLARSQAERLSELKDDFLATLSHELRTPLNSIMGWAVLLQRPPVGDENYRRGLAAIERNARAQTQLVEDLLDMSRVTSGKILLEVSTVTPKVLVEASIESVRALATVKNQHIDVFMDQSDGLISADPGRIKQVISHLLSNAIKFTPERGKIRVQLAGGDSTIEISISDNGCGIARDFLPDLFDRFRQGDTSDSRRYGGLGIGLAIARHLVELHGGAITAASAGENQGSTFTVSLPSLISAHSGLSCDPALDNRLLPPVDIESTTFSGVDILIIDDEEESRDYLRELLLSRSASVTVVSNADDAIQFILSNRPALLLSDIGMPETDGYELLRRVRALGVDAGGGLPAIAVTAFARSVDRTRALRSGFMAHLSKPIKPSELYLVIAGVMEKSKHIRH